MQDLKLIQDNLKEFYYRFSYSIPKAISSYSDTAKDGFLFWAWKKNECLSA